MKESSIAKISWGVVILLFFLVLFVFGLFAWGFVEMIYWITSK